MAFDKHKELEHFFKALEPLNDSSKTIAGQLLMVEMIGRHMERIYEQGFKDGACVLNIKIDEQ